MADKNKARQYKPSTVRRLDTLSGNECAEPNCQKKLIAEDGISITSKICHIAAASSNGPRYDSSMTDNERREFDNLILLCDEHHVIIDNEYNEEIYTVELLKEWKSKHENKISELLMAKNPLSKQPLALNKVVNVMGKQMDEILSQSKVINAPNTENKISYNNILRHQHTIRIHAVYQGKLNKIYEQVEKEGSTRKLVILNNISNMYHTKTIGKDIEWIRMNADNIFDEVEDTILDRIDKAVNVLENFDQETLIFCVKIIMVDAFMRCDILEEPPKLDKI